MSEKEIELKGKYTGAKIFSDQYDQGAVQQIYQSLNNPVFENIKIRVMPDYHVGAGCTIGWTQEVKDKVIPYFVGVDIGCGVTAYPLEKDKINVPAFDSFVHKHIPHGMNMHKTFDRIFAQSTYNRFQDDFQGFEEALETVSRKVNCGRTMNSIGSLGSGNHFIEVDKDTGGSLWLIVHSGSRNFGLSIAEFYQNISAGLTIDKGEYKKKLAEIKAKFSGERVTEEIQKLNTAVKVKGYLDGVDAENYYRDMNIAQIYAQLNRRAMIRLMLEALNLKYKEHKTVESIHNYIDFSEAVPIMRKGAIRAHTGEFCLVPLNMRDGVLFCKGRSNPDWNCSAPHGAGRVYSRSKAKESLSMEDFKAAMDGIYTTCVSTATSDESPMAYKDAAAIIDAVGDTVSIEDHWLPVYNFKASE
jgi:RNA-splicing ligase RtcB